MSKKPKRQRKWVLTFYRPVGEFKNGERRMLKPPRIGKRLFFTENAARKSVCANWKSPFKAFIYKGRKPVKIVEIQVYDPNEDYSGE